MNDGGLTRGPVVVGDDGSRRIEVAVAADAAWFEGHFPGRPVLPAMAQIGLVAALRSDALLAGLDGVRFTEAVAPGDRLAVVLAAAGADGGAAFTIERAGDGARVAGGTARWSDAGGGKLEANQPPRPPDRADAPDPAAVLPHAPPARLAEEVVRLAADGIVCRGRVPPDHPAVGGGRAGAWMALELAAQAAGIYQAAAAAAASAAAPVVGYIVRLRRVRFARPDLPADAALVASVVADGGGGPLSLFRVRVDHDGEALATAQLATFVPPA